MVSTAIPLMCPPTTKYRCACGPRSLFACSGEMYAAVPRITPTPVTIAGESSVGDFREIDSCRRRVVCLRHKPKPRAVNPIVGVGAMFAG